MGKNTYYAKPISWTCDKFPCNIVYKENPTDLLTVKATGKSTKLSHMEVLPQIKDWMNNKFLLI